MSKLVSFLKSFYDSPTYRCLILGLDGSGKTTALYRMALGIAVTTIPTIGFNFEEVHVGNDILTFWDIGGCDKVRPLVRHYMYPGHCILFLVDTASCASNQERFDSTLDELLYHSKEGGNSGLLFIGIALVKQDLLPVSGVEGDVGHQISYVINRVRDAMEGIFPRGFGRTYDIYTNEEQGGISAKMGPGFEDGWLVTELLNSIKRASEGRMDNERYLKEASLDKARKGTNIPVTSPPPPQDGTKLKPALDIDQLRALILKQNSEDPYTNLTPREFLGKMESGTLETWDHRAHLRAGFYVLVDHLKAGYGLWDAAEDFLVKLETMLSNDAKTAEVEKREKRFRNTVHRTMTTFYLHSIHTAILTFMDNQGSSHMLPKHNQFDEFLLLNLHLMDSSLWSAYYSRAVIFSPVAKSSWRLPDLKPLPDHIRIPHTATLQGIEGIKNFNDSPLAEKEHLRRFAFATLQRVRFTGERRGKVIKEALEALQKHTMSQRAKGMDVEPYSETKAYFWIQILHAAIASLGTGVGISGIDITKLSFESFVLLFPDLMRQRDKGKELWRSYYTEKSWEGMEARMGVVLPSLKPLPNLIVPPTEAEREAAVAREMQIRSLVQNGVERNISEMEMMLHEFWVITEIQDTSETAASHGKVLWQIFSKLWKVKVENLMSVGAASNELVGEDLKGRGGVLLGVTEKAFWVRAVMKQFLNCEITLPVEKSVKGYGGGNGGGNGEISLRDFRSFLGENRELSLEDFWKRYYSEETWHSKDAKERFVPPDLKEMANSM